MPQQFTIEYRKERLNQVWNPSFEQTDVGSGIPVNATLALNTTHAVQGRQSLQVVSSTNTTSVSYQTANYQSRVAAGLPYVGSGYIANIVGASRNVRISILFYTKAGAFISQTQSATTTLPSAVSGWSRLEVQATAPASAYYSTLVFETQLTNAAIGNTVVIDAVMIEQTTIPSGGSAPAYFDGSTVDGSYRAYWLSTINNSVSALPTAQWAVLDNVQQISGFIGRQQLADNFEPARLNISARYPNGFNIPNTALKVGTLIRLKRVGSVLPMWLGAIRNVSVQWGIPFNDSTGVGVIDIVDIECEGQLAEWGRLQGNGYSIAASDFITQLNAVVASGNITGYAYDAPIGSTPPLLSYSEITDSYSNWLNTACATIGATIKDGNDNQVIVISSREKSSTLSVSFNDTLNNSTNQVYDQIVFDSVSSDFFTQVELNTTSYGDVVVNYGVAPYRTFTQTTFSNSVSQATDLANYLLGIFGDNGFGISEISCKSEAQNSWALDLGKQWWDTVGNTTFITFRGSLFRCTILGSSFTATPSESRFTYYVADIGLTPFLILDDTSAGILDTNKLGW